MTADPTRMPIPVATGLDGVHIYLCNLNSWRPRSSTHLSGDESARVARFVFPRHAHAFRQAHCFMREVLAHAVNDDPSALVFSATRWDKPRLEHPSGMYFNLSHSDTHAAVALAQQHDVGVDIEDLHPIEDALALAGTHFTPAEQAQLQAAAPGPARDHAFLRGWTRKEACLKAIGSGLSLSATAVDAGLSSTPRTLNVHWDGRAYRLLVASFEPDADVIGAVAKVL
jgi:4'-phosphopantetheinyl transferase